MKELAKRFIDKECLISSFDSNHQFEGVIKEVSDSAILVEKNGTVEAINLDFVIRIILAKTAIGVVETTLSTSTTGRYFPTVGRDSRAEWRK